MKAVASEQRRALGVGLGLVVAWGASFTIQKIAFREMGPDTFLFLRSALMALCAAALLRWRGRVLWPRLGPGQWPAFLTATAAGPVLHIALVTYAIYWSTAFSVALIMAIGPVITLILLRLLRGTRLARRQWLGVGAAFCGVLLVMSDKLLAAASKALDDAVITKRFSELGSTAPKSADRGPASLQKLVESEVARWTPVLKAAMAAENPVSTTISRPPPRISQTK